MLNQAPHITHVEPNSPEFREALAKAGVILLGDEDHSVYSRHYHYEIGTDKVLFEEEVMAGKLALYPLSEQEAQTNGLPSCWAFEADGTVVVLRYASQQLHERSGVDVTSDEFQAKLAAIGQAFAAEGIHETLELNIAGKLFPHGEGEVTYEVTDEEARHQQVTVVPIPPALAAGDWTLGACWGFSSRGEAVVAGMCVRDNSTVLH